MGWPIVGTTAMVGVGSGRLETRRIPMKLAIASKTALITNVNNMLICRVRSMFI
jgi:hypothetical protein